MPASQTPEPGIERTLRSTARNPRRRQRQSDTDSIKAAPRRKRSKLSENSFAPRPSVEGGNEEDGTALETAMNGHPRGSVGRSTREESMPALDTTELPVRGGKRVGTLKHRPLKGDGATTLAQNNFYSVKLLPSTPKELREAGLEFHGSLSNATNGQHLALAVTRTKAYVWDYSAHTTVGNARVFDVPFPVRQSEVLPLGALVVGGASTEIGLLLVSAASGKIAFFESIERAASLSLFQERRSCIEGSITGFSLNESVTAMINADHAGFILTLSSGRVMQLCLRDGHGKARIFTQPLHSDDSNVGILGSIKGWYSGGSRRKITAVRTRALDPRGHMEVIALTDKGEFLRWNLDWSGWHEYNGTVDIRELLLHELSTFEVPETQGSADSAVVLDFVVADKPYSRVRGNEVAITGAQQPLDTLVLVRAGPIEKRSYYLMELVILGNSVTHRRTTALDTYRAESSAHKPRLLLPKPGHTAFIIFDRAVVLAATADAAYGDDPNAQLHEASYVRMKPFEDAISLPSDKDCTIMDAAAEEAKGTHCSSMVFVKGAGLLRISATDPAMDVERSALPAKTRIEQAVFYGAMQDNILDFSLREDESYSLGELEEAALAISDEILRSDTPFIATAPASIEAHLDYRARALTALITFMTVSCSTLSMSTSWQLLWNAEKLAAAQQMWLAFEEHKVSPRADHMQKRVATVIDAVCDIFNEQNESAVRNELREHDLVRRFFIGSLDQVPFLLSRLRMLLEHLRLGDGEHPEETLRHAAEADDVWLRALEAVYTFRSERASAYGIHARLVDEGALDPEHYKDLPDFWTSSNDMLKASQQIPKLSRELAKNFYENHLAPETSSHIQQLRHLNADLIEMMCRMYQERITWLLAQPSVEHQSLARRLQENYDADRHDQLRALASIGCAEQGMRLAEKYRDMQTLTEIVVAESQYYWSELQGNISPEDRSTCLQLITQMTERIGRYFEKCGDAWSNAFFDEAFSSSRAGEMLEKAQEYWGNPLTKYLRAAPGRARLCWINDVTTARDLAHAGLVLTNAADEESKLWAKKVELSMSKLALLAAEEDPNPDAAVKEALTSSQHSMEIIELQERLYHHIRSEAFGALDHEAEIDLVMKRFATQTATYPALERLLQLELDRLMSHEVLSIDDLVDVLTLIDPTLYGDATERKSANLDGQEYFFALSALDRAAQHLNQARFQMLLQLIWKRCYIADEWDVITTRQTQKGGTDIDIRGALSATTAYRTFYYLHSSTKLVQPSTHVRVLQPSECLGSACNPNDLAHRWSDSTLLDHILRDNKIQDEVLQGYVVDRQLNEWATDCERYAKEAVNEEAEMLAERRERERHIQERLERTEKTETNGQGNGHTNGGFERFGAMSDVDGNVAMA
ncbi:hypothetical protein BAUCODRAFT_106312 [Baudoinia panamericana UAMH 10762]|uniref:Nucleoporin Nup133/Nup155-like C-terminal domain-containing protein n=1 Tax=Baudoinia panamericana (strain UAMH 10762) TaxID=717646 RepID=M2NDS9_BAUPA|nr:uncharacterized protein BAUCODRAFT_106312 [Baudoinia panamericana UAMH 10762]EMC97055.1 hypothetical protein BAUCODRAFT_106312 [Baudoinia panamericana UAMH 10762]